MLADINRSTSVIGQRLQIGDQDGLVVLMLERQTGAQRAGEVSQVQGTSGTISREHYLPAGS
jgi:hypothetical protein